MALTAEETSALLTVALQETPAVIDAIKSLFAKSNPDATAPTSADVIAAFDAAFKSSIAVDEAWIATHPVQ